MLDKANEVSSDYLVESPEDGKSLRVRVSGQKLKLRLPFDSTPTLRPLYVRFRHTTRQRDLNPVGRRKRTLVDTFVVVFVSPLTKSY